MRLSSAVLATAVLSGLPFPADAISLYVGSPLAKQRCDVAPDLTAKPTLSSSRSYRVFAARREFEAFQIVVNGASGVSVTASASAVTRVDGAAVAAANLPQVRLFRMACINANRSAPGSIAPTTGAVPIPDAMVPDVDDVIDVKRNAFPFSFATGRLTQTIWVEVFVPSGAPWGDYRATIAVNPSDSATDADVTLDLTVWDFALPATSTLKNTYFLPYEALRWGHALPDPGVSWDAFVAANVPLRQRYTQLALDHRITIANLDDGDNSVAHVRTAYGPFIAGTAGTRLAGARLTMIRNLGTIGATGTKGERAWLDMAVADGWSSRIFQDTADEPDNMNNNAWCDIHSASATDRVSGTGRLCERNGTRAAALETEVRNAGAAGFEYRRQVSAAITDVKDTQRTSPDGLNTPHVANLDGWVDVLAVLPRHIAGLTQTGGADGRYADELSSLGTWRSGSSVREYWMYQSCDTYACSPASAGAGWPSLTIDMRGIHARALEWLTFSHSATGELYWSVASHFSSGNDPWTNQAAFGAQGDGTLFYPGTRSKLGHANAADDIPVASYRLKMIREGMEDWEYLKLAPAAVASAKASSLFPAANSVTEAKADTLMQVRQELAQEILCAAGSPQCVTADFTVSASTASVTAPWETRPTSTITVSAVNGFAGSVTLTATTNAPDATVSLASSSLSLSSTATSRSTALTMTAAATTPPGSYTVTVSAQAGSLSHQTTVTWRVSDFTVAATSPGSTTAGSSGTSTITVSGLQGFSGTLTLSATSDATDATFSFSPASVALSPTTTSASSTLTLRTGTASPGTYTVTVTAAGGGASRTAEVSWQIIAAPADFTVAASPNPLTTPVSTAGGATITVSGANGFTGAVTLSATSTAPGTTFAFATNPVSLSSTATSATSVLTLTPSSTTAAGSYTVTVTATSGALSRQTTFTLRLSDFSVATPTSLTATAGESVQGTVTVSPSTGFTGSVALSLTGLPAGATASFNPASVSISGTSAVASTLTLAAGTAQPGTYPLTIKGTSGSLARTATIYWQITAVAPSFSVAASPASVTSAIGGSAASTLSTTPRDGFAGTVTFSVSGIPAGSSFSAPPVTIASGSTAAATTTLTLNAGSAAAGSYPLTVTGTSGTTASGTTVNWTIASDNRVELLTDDFSALDSSKWSVRTSVAGDGASARKGLLTLTPTANTGSAGVFVNSVKTYSLRGSSATVNALEVVSAGGGINSKFMFHAPGADEFREVVGFWFEGGTLYAYYYRGGVQFSAGSSAYDRDAHAWWRLRHSGTTLYWETSRDRQSWAVLGQVLDTATFNLSSGVLGFNVKAYGSGNSVPGQARFTYLNLAPVPLASFTDPFTSLDPARWYVSTDSPGSTVTAGGGVLSISPEPNNGDGGGRVISMRPYALTGSSIVIKVPQVVSSGSNVNQIFRVGPGPFAWDDAIGFWLERGKLYLYQEAFGATSSVGTVLTFSQTSHAWWRLRETAGTVYWDTSPDGVTWTERASSPVRGLSFSTAIVSVYVSANEWSTGNPDPGTARFSNLNSP